MRQNIYLRHRKASSPVSNALGSLIFLGTPFFVKRWNNLQKALFCLSIVVESLIAGEPPSTTFRRLGEEEHRLVWVEVWSNCTVWYTMQCMMEYIHLSSLPPSLCFCSCLFYGR